MEKKTEKKIVIFDFDGTLWDTAPLVLKNAQNLFKDLKTAGQIKEMYTNNFDSLFDLAEKKGEIVNEAEKEKFLQEYYRLKLSSKPFSGIEEILNFLKSKNIIVGISSLSKKAGILPILEKNNFLKYFDFIMTREDHISKVENVFYTLLNYKFNTDEAIFITDTLGDVREMNVLGMETIAVLYGMHDSKFFEREKNENLIAKLHTVKELKSKLEKIV